MCYYQIHPVKFSIRDWQEERKRQQERSHRHMLSLAMSFPEHREYFLGYCIEPQTCARPIRTTNLLTDANDKKDKSNVCYISNSFYDKYAIERLMRELLYVMSQNEDNINSEHSRTITSIINKGYNTSRFVSTYDVDGLKSLLIKALNGRNWEFITRGKISCITNSSDTNDMFELYYDEYFDEYMVVYSVFSYMYTCSCPKCVSESYFANYTIIKNTSYVCNFSPITYDLSLIHAAEHYFKYNNIFPKELINIIKTYFILDHSCVHDGILYTYKNCKNFSDIQDGKFGSDGSTITNHFNKCVQVARNNFKDNFSHRISFNDPVKFTPTIPSFVV